jgi:hypothetical protein
MEEGMGIIRRGGALAEELGPALGRDLGLGADRERPVGHLVGMPQEKNPEDHATHHGVTPAPGQVPGFPQEMWMPMDHLIDRPENHGLRKDWTASMMGMMTMVRVLPPDLHEKITDLQRQRAAQDQA